MSKCLTCGRTLRPKGGRAADHPGTVGRSSSVECKRCRDAVLRLAGLGRLPRGMSGAQLEWALVEARRMRDLEDAR